MFGLPWDQISALLRNLLMFAGGIAVSHGYLNVEQLTGLVGGILSILAVLWGIKVNTAKAVTQSAAAIPGNTVIAAPALAQSTPEDNIVSNNASPQIIAAVVAQEAKKVSP